MNQARYASLLILAHTGNHVNTLPLGRVIINVNTYASRAAATGESPAWSPMCQERRLKKMRSILIKDTTREERIRIVHQALWGSCGIDCEFCSGCDNRGGGRTESIYQPYIDGIKEIREINEEFRAPFVRG